jgi:hypothetical protein
VRRYLGAAAALALVAWPGVASGQGLDDLASRVSAAIEVAEEGLSEPRPQLMDEVRSTLGLPDRVEVSGRPIDVAPDQLLSALGGDSTADFEVALRRLRTMRAAILETAAASPPAEAELRRDLATSSEAFGSSEPSLLERIRRSIDAFLTSLARRGAAALRGGPAWILLVGAAVLVAVTVWRLRPGAVPLAAVPRRTARPAGEWRARAEAARGRGDLTEAVVALYRSLVAGLAERGLVEDRPSLTAGEIRAAAAGDPRLGAVLSEATRRYERVRYGMDPPSEADLRALLEADRGARAA